MSISPSFPIHNDLDDRPVSVYDNLTNNQLPNGTSRDHPKTTNGDPLKNISFKFDDRGVSLNGGVSYPNMHAQHSSPSSPPVESAYGPNKGSPVKQLINYNGTTGVKCKTSHGLSAPTSPNSGNSSPISRDSLAGKTSPRSMASGGSAIMSDLERGSDRESAPGTTTTFFKPAISDAKSRFFGLTTGDVGASNENHSESASTPLLNETNSVGDRQVRINPIVSDPSIADHQYQNIPPNSAIFRTLNDPGSRSAKEPSDTISMTSSPVAQPPTIVTTDLSAPETDRGTPDKSRANSDDTRSNRRRNTNSFHADTDLNFNQQPSQVIYMSTTVPQNIKSPNIAGRHTPTRNSLRHSRMLVVNKNYPGLNVMNPLGLRHPKVARLLLIILLILGLMITGIGIWILLWAPYTKMQDNPYWSGLSLVLAATLGLIVIKFKRIKRQKIREHCFTFLKLDSMMLCMIASFLCLMAFTCASLHLSNLYSPTTKCASTNIFIANASCICIFGARDTNFTPPNGTISVHPTEDLYSGGYEFNYRDLSCSEVNGAWRYLLMASVVLNVLGFFLSTCYILLACFKKKDKRKYNSIRTDVF